MVDSIQGSASGSYFGIFEKIRALNICDEHDADLYGSALADFYNEFVGCFAGDIPLFERLTPMSGALILDLACGSARISISLARAGAYVDGIELSKDMLALIQHNLRGEPSDVIERLNFYEGDITQFDMKRAYDLIILGVTSISLLLRREQRRAMFDCVARNLRTTGKFIFDILDLEGEKWKELDNFQDVWSVETESGTDFAIVGQRFYPDERKFTLNVYREIVGWDGDTCRKLGFSTKAWIDRAELIEDLTASGLRIVEEFKEDSQLYFVSMLDQEVARI